MARPKNVDMWGRRQCTSCKEYKEPSAFYQKRAYKGHKYYSPSCKPCHIKYNTERFSETRLEYYSKNKRRIGLGQKARQQRNRDYLWNYYLIHPCTDCGQENPIVLEAHHVDPTFKREGISAMSSGTFSIPTLEAELSKCIILCSNCHKLRHAEANNSSWWIRWQTV